jgi:hypothetical protein
MKLTDELLTQLVNEEMQRVDERSLPVTVTGRSAADKAKSIGLTGRKAKIPPFQDIKALISNDDNDKQLSQVDLQVAFAGGPGQATADELAKNALPARGPDSYRNQIQQVKKDTALKSKEFTDDEKQAMSKAGAEVSSEPSGEVDVSSLTFPRIYNAPADMTSGKFLGSENELIKSIFSGATVADRLVEFTRVSESIWQEGINEDNPKKNLQYAMFVDLINGYINLIDDRSAGYAFESLCAMLCGGKVSGGENGVADFTIGEQIGSCKLYSKWGIITQAAAGFKLMKPVHYVLGMINRNEEAVNEGERKTSSKLTVKTVDMCYTVVTLVEEKDGMGRFTISDHMGDAHRLTEWIPMQKGTKVNVVEGISQENASMGKMTLVGGGNTFKQHLDKKYSKGDSDTAKAYKSMEAFFKSLFEAEENTKKYVAVDTTGQEGQTKAASYGNAASTHFDSAGKDLTVILKLLGGYATRASDQGNVPEDNQKLTEELLDKLIKQVIL